MALLVWRRGVKRIAWTTVLIVFFCPFYFCASRAQEEPDREMLRVMELLQEWEIINDLDTIKQLVTLERMEETSAEMRNQEPQSEEKDKEK